MRHIEFLGKGLDRDGQQFARVGGGFLFEVDVTAIEAGVAFQCL